MDYIISLTLNTFFWFQLPIQGPVIDPITGNVNPGESIVNRDINAFIAGIKGSGLFQGGFFPVMMGGYLQLQSQWFTQLNPKIEKK